MNTRKIWSLAGVLAMLCAGARAETLTIGDAAPKLDVSKWVKGDEVKSLDKGIYVVEFWATWCGPCKVSIPHLTELQKEHKDVTMIGVSVWEEDASAVEPFVKEMGDKMEYRVAMDRVPEGKKGNEGAMASTWMEAAGENGIPAAFIVKDGKIAWIGHPMSMDKPLKAVVGGTYDIAAAAKERKEAQEMEGKLQELQAAVIPPFRSGKYKEALEALDKQLASNAKFAEIAGIQMLRMNLLLRTGDGAKAVEQGRKLLENKELSESAEALNQVAWGIIDPAVEDDMKPGKEVLAFALEVAKKASDLEKGENAAVLDTLALAYFKTGDKAKALETQKKCIALYEKSKEEIDPSIKERLEKYQKAVDGKDEK